LKSQILTFKLITIEEHTKNLEQESKRREKKNELVLIDAEKRIIAES